ncbi:hypothetical protein VTG60DRAFT_553 [Thermothelomyces hinnuleus]
MCRYCRADVSRLRFQAATEEAWTFSKSPNPASTLALWRAVATSMPRPLRSPAVSDLVLAKTSLTDTGCRVSAGHDDLRTTERAEFNHGYHAARADNMT